MQRREFSIRTSAAAATLATASVLAGAARAQGAKPIEGIDYLTLEKPAPRDAVGKIEVVEFFWYSCQHCNRFEPQLEDWAKRLPPDAVLRRVPVAFKPDFEPQQRLYFVLESMGKVAELHKKVFSAIHVEKQLLNTAEQVTEWATKQGIDKAKFLDAYNSFAVATKSRKATALQDAFKVDGVPSLGVAGKYFTSGAIAQTMERALLVTDYLLGLTRDSMQRAEAPGRKPVETKKAG